MINIILPFTIIIFPYCFIYIVLSSPSKILLYCFKNTMIFKDKIQAIIISKNRLRSFEDKLLFEVFLNINRAVKKNLILCRFHE